MKSRAQIIFVLALLLGMAVVFSVKRAVYPGRARNAAACCPLLVQPDVGPPAAVMETIVAPVAVMPVIAYYFHGTVRCEACLLIEAQAQSVIEQEFSAEVAANQILFTTVDYDLPENAHFLTDYQLPCPSLVPVRQNADGQEEWKLLGEAWPLVGEPLELNQFLQNEVRDFLARPTSPDPTRPVASPAASTDP